MTSKETSQNCTELSMESFAGSRLTQMPLLDACGILTEGPLHVRQVLETSSLSRWKTERSKDLSAMATWLTLHRWHGHQMVLFSQAQVRTTLSSFGRRRRRELLR